MLTESELPIAQAAGFIVKRRYCEWLECHVELVEVPEHDGIVGMTFQMTSRPTWSAVIHRCTHPGEKTWQVSFFDDKGPYGHTCRSTLTEALLLARGDGFLLTSVRHHHGPAQPPVKDIAMLEFPESILDDAAAVGDADALDARADRIFRRQQEAGAGPNPRHRRAAVLEYLALAYTARAAAIRARLAGPVTEALKLERQSERCLSDARVLAATKTPDVTFHELMSLRGRDAT